MNKGSIEVKVTYAKVLMLMAGATSIASRVKAGMSKSESRHVSDAYHEISKSIRQWDAEQHPTHIRVHISGKWHPEDDHNKVIHNTVVISDADTICELKEKGALCIKAAMEAWAV